MGTRPLKLVNRSESHQLRDRLQQDMSRWATEWLVGESGVQVTVATDVAPDMLHLTEWRVRRRDDGGGAAMGVVTGDLSFRRRLMGMTDAGLGNADDPVLRALEEAARDAALTALLGAADGKPGELPVPAEYQATGSGYVFARCRIDDTLDVLVLLWPHSVRTWLDGRAPGLINSGQDPVSRLDALDLQTIAIDVVVGEAEIVFDEFRSLCEGFVIKLDRRLDQPLRVRLVGDGVLCAGHLGLNGDKRAVQVTTTN